MQAIILAAGRGSRLGSSNAGMPKCLLEIDRIPIVEHQLQTLAEAGVGPVALVVGYCGDEIRERLGIRAEYLVNPNWNTTNSLHSFWLARNWIKGPVVILNCDILFDSEILERVLRANGDAIAFDSSSGDGREHMKVKVVDGNLRGMSKQLPAEDTAGENVGLLSFTEGTARAVVDKAGELLEGGAQKEWLGAAVKEVAKERAIGAVDVAGLPWGEIDFPVDLERARKEVWPAIARRKQRRKPARRFGRIAATALLVFGALGGALAIGWVSHDPAATWDSVDLVGAPRAELAVGNGVRPWHLLTARKRATAVVEGPAPLRIETRVLLRDNPAEKMPYVLEVSLDGKRVDWYKLSARASSKARYNNGPIGKQRRIVIDLPPGDHTVEVGLVAADSGRCLIRLREMNPESDAD